MILKIHKSDGRKLIALCDSDLIGKRFEEGNLQLDLTSAFYDGSEVKDKEAKDALKDADMIHAVGGKSISFLKENIIVPEKVMKVKGIPHAQIII